MFFAFHITCTLLHTTNLQDKGVLTVLISVHHTQVTSHEVNVC